MQNPFEQFGLFLLACTNHLFTLLAGCVVTVVIAILEKRILKRAISLKLEVGILSCFVFFACFQAWHDQYEIAVTAGKTSTPSPKIEVNVPPPGAPQVIMVNQGGSPTVTGYIQISNIQPVANMQRVAEGKDVGMNVFFQDPGPMPIQDFQNIVKLAIGSEKDESKLGPDFESYVKEKMKESRGMPGTTVGSTASPMLTYNSAYLRNLSHDDAAGLLDGSKRLYVQVRSSWRDENGHTGHLDFCGWIQELREEIPTGGMIFHSCLIKAKK